MSNSNDDILDRISKLLAKAKGTSNEHEAAVFAAKAAELLAKHNLDEEMLRQRDVNREEGPIGEYSYDKRSPDRWRELILQGCAKVYFCEIIRYSGAAGRRRHTFVGREHNAKVAMLMAEYLINTVKRMAREHCGASRADQGDFRRGAGLRLYQRLVDLYNAQNATAPTASGGNLPALYRTEENAIAEWKKAMFGDDIRKARTKSIRIGAYGAAGMAAADKISLNTQIRETRANRLLT